MIRIAGIDLPEQKKVRFALRYLYGVGLTRSNQILKEANVDPDKRTAEETISSPGARSSTSRY